MAQESYRRYARMRVIFLQDIVLSLLASLLAILLVRWVTEPIAGFTALVAGYLGVSLAATCAVSRRSAPSERPC